MALAALLTLTGAFVAGLIGLVLCRAMLRCRAPGVEQLAAAGLMQALANCGPLSGVSSRSIDRARALCASALIPAPSRQPGRFHG